MLTRTTIVKEIPGEPGSTMTFRQLGWRQLAECQEMKQITSLRTFRGMGDLLKSLQNNKADLEEQAAADRADGKEPEVDPLVKYDMATVLHFGVVAWSYPEKLNPDNLDALDEETAKWAATEIVNLGKPPAEKDIEDRFFGSQDSSMATPATATVAMKAAVGSIPNGLSA